MVISQPMNDLELTIKINCTYISEFNFFVRDNTISGHICRNGQHTSPSFITYKENKLCGP